MSKLITILLAAGMLSPAARIITAPTYTTDLHVVCAHGDWVQLEDDEHCAMLPARMLHGSTEAGTVYTITWNTHYTYTTDDDTAIKTEEVM